MKTRLNAIAFEEASDAAAMDRGIAALLEVALDALEFRGARLAAAHVCTALAFLVIQHEADREGDLGEIGSFE